MLEDNTLSNLAAIPTPLPQISDYEVFTPQQWATFLAIGEVFIPDLTSCLDDAQYKNLLSKLHEILPKSEDESLIRSYLGETTAGDATFKENVRYRLAGYVPKAQSKGLALLLSALNTRIGSFIMTGSTELLHTRSLTERTRIVLNWSESYIGPLRALFGGAESLTRATWLAQSTTFHQLLDYPKVPKNIERHPSYGFKFQDFSTSTADVAHVQADILIIGSGCGAGVVAEHLSSALSKMVPKPRILLVEKGYHFPSSHFPMDQAAAGVNIQEGGGIIMSDDGSMGVLAGSTWGGGGTINWSASLQPHRKVREEWATKQDLPFLVSSEYQECLDEVCDKMGVCRAYDAEGLAKIEQNYGNAALLESSRRLGYHAAIVPQNTAGKRHYCGRCGMGCASATKQGPANFWLPAAAENGVEFIEGCFVDEIVWDETKYPRVATGVKATWQSRDRGLTRKLKITAKHVVVSSGTLHSPLLLHRSGLTPSFNNNIGAHLHLHPTATVKGTYIDRVDPWDGAILTSVMTSFEDLDGKGHGPKVELLLGIPELAGVLMPLRPQLSLRAITKARSGAQVDQAALNTALDWRVRAATHGHSFTYIIIQRDHADELNSKKSYVYQDPKDETKVKIKYTPSLKDREHIVKGMVAAARMHYVMGAKTIEVCSPLVEPFERPTTNADIEFEAWLSSIQNLGAELLNPTRTRLGSAHQMGTCRMSSSPDKGVVDSTGKVHGTQNVFVADASILPSASGVNPMVSTMALSLHVARKIAGIVRNS